MKIRLLLTTLVAAAVFVSAFKMSDRVTSTPSKVMTKTHAPVIPLPHYAGKFTTGDDPGEPFDVYVTGTVVNYCIAENNGSPAGLHLPATGSYNSSTNSVTNFSCTYAVHNVTPPEDNTVNYTGPLD